MKSNYDELKESLNSVGKSIRDVLGEIECVKRTKEIYESRNQIGDFGDMLSVLNKEVNNLKKDQDKIIEQITEIQNSCEHDFVYIGHDSHYDYYTCKKCGAGMKD